MLNTKTVLDYPLKPAPFNFTPPERTPWGGSRIAELKAGLGVPKNKKIGESWEISGHPDFPNIFQIGGKKVTLPELLKKYPEEILGKRNLKRFGPQMPILAKLLNAEDWLSVQVHPKPDYPGLKPGEHSKTEAWHILHSEPGSGIYLGFKYGVTKKQVQRVLNQGEDLNPLLYFTPVKKGETYFVPAGTPHAIGPGLFLYEPQETSATTYRFYDFGRRDAAGVARPLHIEDSLGATDWEGAREATLIQKLRKDPPPSVVGWTTLISSPQFVLNRLVLERTAISGDSSTGIQGLTLIDGMLEIRNLEGEVVEKLQKGESAIFPACFGKYQLSAKTDFAIALQVQAG